MNFEPANVIGFPLNSFKWCFNCVSELSYEMGNLNPEFTLLFNYKGLVKFKRGVGVRKCFKVYRIIYGCIFLSLNSRNLIRFIEQMTFSYSLYLSLNLSLYLSIYLSLFLSIYLSLSFSPSRFYFLEAKLLYKRWCPSACLYVCMPVCMSGLGGNVIFLAPI